MGAIQSAARAGRGARTSLTSSFSSSSGFLVTSVQPKGWKGFLMTTSFSSSFSTGTFLTITFVNLQTGSFSFSAFFSDSLAPLTSLPPSPSHSVSHFSFFCSLASAQQNFRISPSHVCGTRSIFSKSICGGAERR